MTIYNFNKGIGWASSGIEYAQAYRSNIFKKNGQKAKFIFTEFFSENLEPLTKNIGFKDEEIIWLYQYFTDIKVSPTTYSLDQLINTFSSTPTKVVENKGYMTYFFEENHLVINAFLDKSAQGQCVYKTEIIVQGKLIQRDYYNYVKTVSEYFKPVENQANLYQRRFFNEDGSIVYDELLNGKQSLFIFEDRTIFSIQNLIMYFMECLNLSSKDIVLLDRSTDIGPAIFKSKGPAKIGVIIHAEHFSDHLTDGNYILWNNYYDYQFKNANLIDFFVCPTEKQKEIIDEQFKFYKKGNIKVYPIPVGSIDQTRHSNQRNPNALITASRLAEEKHIDWLVEAVVEARKTIKNLTLDIYGEGGERGKIEQLISKFDAQNYIQLKGQQNLTEVYTQYKTYVAASTSEGFGLSLLEAVGSGLAMIGFDVRYGNQTFIKQGENGYLLEYSKNHKDLNIQRMCSAIVNLHQLSQEERTNLEITSYEIAQPFLTKNIQNLWLKLEKEIIND